MSPLAPPLTLLSVSPVAGSGEQDMASRWRFLERHWLSPLGKPLERDMLELIKFKLKYRATGEGDKDVLRWLLGARQVIVGMNGRYTRLKGVYKVKPIASDGRYTRRQPSDKGWLNAAERPGHTLSHSTVYIHPLWLLCLSLWRVVIVWEGRPSTEIDWLTGQLTGMWSVQSVFEGAYDESECMKCW